ncbi:MAG: hypothetical protein JXA57_05805 [Armatimonadetes bacterium]|nr:hypothetical protein [Armatimonadota bacterium]
MDYFLAVVQVLTLVALVVYVWKTWQMASATRSSVDEMRETRLAETRPYVLLFAERDRGSPLFVDLVLRNFGKSGARDIVLSLSPELQASWGGLANCAFLSGPVGFLAPGAELRTHFDSSRDYFNKELPGHYVVEVTYQDERGRTDYAESFVLNLEQFKGMSWLERKDLNDMYKVLESLGKSVDKTNQTLSEVVGNLRHGLLTIPAQAEGGVEGVRQLVEGIVGAAAVYTDAATQKSRWGMAKDVQRLVAWQQRVLLLVWSQVPRSGSLDEQWGSFFGALTEVADFSWYIGAGDDFVGRVTALKEQAELLLRAMQSSAET